MVGTVTITARLRDPEETWVHEQPVEFPPGKEAAIIMQMLLGIRTVGLTKTLEAGRKVQLIPEGRVIDYVAELSTISLADNLDMASAIGGAKAPSLA